MIIHFDPIVDRYGIGMKRINDSVDLKQITLARIIRKTVIEWIF